MGPDFVVLVLEKDASPLPAEAIIEVVAATVSSKVAAEPVKSETAANRSVTTVVATRADDKTSWGVQLYSEAPVLRGSRILEVTAGGAFDESGLTAEDVISKIDGVSVLDEQHEGVIAKFLQPSTQIELVMLHPENVDTPTRTVVLKRAEGQSLGMQISETENDEFVRVLSVVHGGIADQTGLVFMGDRIVQVNGVPMKNIGYDGVAGAFQGILDNTIVVATDRTPTDDSDSDNDSSGNNKQYEGAFSGMTGQVRHLYPYTAARHLHPFPRLPVNGFDMRFYPAPS